MTVEIKHPKRWVLIGGPFYFAKHKAWLHTIISGILAIATGGISCLIYPFFGEWIIRNAYLGRGWIEMGEDEAAASDYDAVAKFDKLIKSKNKGIISEEEFNQQKNELFGIVPGNVPSTPKPAENSTDIPKEVRYEVWQRDLGRCAHCGDNAGLEFCHIVPLSKGGENIAKNVHLLCEKCYG